ncbi:MAG: hypothetical protein M0T80_11590, partial [Actinomycetota bacterium]|nr:hypothetical protein [Actinomycetota bacterium]
MLPAVAGLDRVFDYLVEPVGSDAVRVGTVVRVDLSGRRVGGWVVRDSPWDPSGPGGPGGEPARRALRPLAHVSGWGPEPELVGLAG